MYIDRMKFDFCFKDKSKVIQKGSLLTFKSDERKTAGA